MKKTMDYRSCYMEDLFEGIHNAIAKEENRKQRGIMYENCTCQYKTILFLCEENSH